jgi:putative protein-disulfide isomerase
MKLYYVMDPMCSWCWGFQPVFRRLIARLPPAVVVEYVMGGLAADSAEPMSQDTRDYVQSQWQAVEDRTGVHFNWDFWSQCQPRRSTYPACRAVIAAGMQHQDKVPQMIAAIQQAYYQQARNPSDAATLLTLATEIDLDSRRFASDLDSPELEQQLHQHFARRRQLQVTSFPSLRLQTNNVIKCIDIDYSDEDRLISQITLHIPNHIT